MVRLVIFSTNILNNYFIPFLVSFFSMEKKINKQMKREREQSVQGGGGSVKLQLRSLRQYPEIFLIKKKDFKPWVELL